MDHKRAKAFALMGGVGLSIVLALHLLMCLLGVLQLGAAWTGFYAPWLVFLIIGLIGLKQRRGDSA